MISGFFGLSLAFACALVVTATTYGAGPDHAPGMLPITKSQAGDFKHKHCTFPV